MTVRRRRGVHGQQRGHRGFQRLGSSVNLGSVNTKGNFIKNKRTTTFNATMTATTVITAGVPKTVVTVTLGAPTSGSGLLRTSSTPVAMVRTPTSSVTSTSGAACSLSPVTKTRTLDRDF